ncbi:MAG: methyltransferase domain-containing protein, partial [Terriglobia bacterium]
FEVSRKAEEHVATAKYQGIVCSSVIEYVPDARGLLREFRRWLRPTGSLIISFANRSSLWFKYARWRFGRTAPHYRFQLNVYTSSEFRELLNGAGFSVMSGPEFFEMPPFDKRPYLAVLGRSPLVGTLGLVVARPMGTP